MSTYHSVISNIDRAKFELVCKKNDILAVYLFGSLAEGFPDALSDIDFGIVFSKGKDLSQLSFLFESLFAQFSETLDSAAGDHLDLVFLQKAGPLVADKAIRGKLLFCSNDEERLEFEDDALMKALDFKPWIEQYYKDMLLAVRKGGGIGR